MSQAKRMIYIRDENLDFYNTLENKSDFINECLKTARLGGVDNIKVSEVEEGAVIDPNAASSLGNALDAMRERDLKALEEYRKKNGITPPAGA